MNPKRILPILIILALAIAAGGWYYLNYIAVNDDGLLTASGTVEAIEVSVSPESGGKVAQVYVEEGQAVKKGDALLELDATLLTAQRDRALAALESAQAGYETAIAGDAEEALAYLDAHHPDLITLDIGLPDMRGDELAARIKSDIATRDIPILVISVYAEDPANMQFAAYALPKPIEQDALLDTVGSLLQGTRRVPC
jgi:multidrug efflux pump subunit AcrA (membrane-fusion protein)